MSRFLITILANAFGIWLADQLIRGFDFSDGILELIGAGLLLALLNWILRPLVKLITGPLVIVTLGAFIIVINGLMLWILDLLVPSLVIQNFAALLVATLLMSALNIVVSTLKKSPERAS